MAVGLRVAKGLLYISPPNSLRQYYVIAHEQWFACGVLISNHLHSFLLVNSDSVLSRIVIQKISDKLLVLLWVCSQGKAVSL